MYLVLIAWIYVAFMMAAAEATSPIGSLLGAVFTFLLYGVLPMGVVAYIMGTPARRRAIKAQNAKTAVSVPPDANGEPSSQTVTPIRKEP